MYNGSTLPANAVDSQILGSGSFTRKAWNLEAAPEKPYAHVVHTSGLRNPCKAVTDEIKHAVGLAANSFENAGIAGSLAAALDMQIAKDGFTANNVCKTAALLIANACMLHRRLLGHIPNLKSLNDVISSEDSIGMLRNAWKCMLENGQHPVFRPALDALRLMPASVIHTIRQIADCANRMADKLGKLDYDHSGPLYHDILDTAQSDSAYYTQPTAAVMLARLALSNGIIDWRDKKAVGRMRVIDPACGTGTLLMASLQTIKHRVKAAGGDASSVHKTAVGDILCGLDINRHAVQMAVCNFILGVPTTNYKHMRLYTMPHGPSGSSAKSGSVEMLLATNQNDAVQAPIQTHTTTDDLEAKQVKDCVLDIQLGGYDMVIMNPPFGRNQSRNRKFPPDVVRRLQRNELSIKNELSPRDRAASDAIDANSISTFFTPLADRLLKRNSGVLAKVAPITACVGAAGLNERRFLSDRFHIEYVISSHDPKRINFSYNTRIHECLLVCRRKDKPHPPTKFVSLRKMPSTMGEAAKAADAIARGGAADLGGICSWPAENMEAGDWSPVQWYDPGIAKIVRELESSPHLEAIGANHAIGPAGRRISDAYEPCSEGDDGALRVFHSISTSIRTSVSGEPESWHRPKDAKRALAARYWDMRSSLLVAFGFRTTGSRLTAVYSDNPSVGIGWVPVSVRDKREAKALAAWWNSTPVMMMLLNRRSKTLDYPKWTLDNLKEIRVPKPDNPAWDALYGACEAVQDMEMPPFNSDAESPLRKKIDEAAAIALGIKPDKIATWRERLLKEPTISNKTAE